MRAKGGLPGNNIQKVSNVDQTAIRLKGIMHATKKACVMRIHEIGFATLLLVVFMAGCADRKGIIPGAEIVPGLTVEGKIIVIDKLVLIENEYFNFDKPILTQKGERMLQQNIKIMEDNPGLKVRIAGYASAQGTTEYNHGLSERRADAVMTYLINEGGIEPSRLDTIGYGETRPSIYEENPEEITSKAAKANMRVLFEVIVK